LSGQRRSRRSSARGSRRKTRASDALSHIPPTHVFLNGIVLTMDPARPEAQAVAILGDRIVAVGKSSELSALAGPSTAVVDLKGATVLPGFIDCHTHLIQYGLGLKYLDLRDVRSIYELKEHVAEASKGDVDWILGRGWDQEKFAEKRYPTRHDLDEASPEKPVLLRRLCGHICVANSTALNEAGVDEHSVDPPGGVIDRDAEGAPTGILRENAVDILDKAVPSPEAEEYEEAILAACQDALKAGLTTVHCIIDSNLELRALLKLRAAHRLPIRFYVIIPAEQLSDVNRLGLRTGFGDEWVRLGAIKIFADGSLGARTAALEAPYNDDPTNLGVTIHRQEELDELVAEAHQSDMQVAIHAIGDRASRMVLKSLAKATAQTSRELRHRIEHASVLSQDLISELGESGAIVSVQPHFIVSDFWLVRRLGSARASLTYPFASLVRAGVRVVAGSDCPIEPMAPLTGIAAAVGRLQPEETITVEEGIALYTRDAAYASFDEGVKGTIERGKYADLTVLRTDPRSVNASEISGIQVALTVVGGEIMYRSHDSN